MIETFQSSVEETSVTDIESANTVNEFLRENRTGSVNFGATFCQSKRESLFSTHSKDVVVPSLTYLQVTVTGRDKARGMSKNFVRCRSDTCNAENKSILHFFTRAPSILVIARKKKSKTALATVKTLRIFSSRDFLVLQRRNFRCLVYRRGKCKLRSAECKFFTR